jgi:hypothetical protein
MQRQGMAKALGGGQQRALCLSDNIRANSIARQ